MAAFFCLLHCFSYSNISPALTIANAFNFVGLKLLDRQTVIALGTDKLLEESGKSAVEELQWLGAKPPVQEDVDGLFTVVAQPATGIDDKRRLFSSLLPAGAGRARWRQAPYQDPDGQSRAAAAAVALKKTKWNASELKTLSSK
jgi:hypothetical protein